ncbi:MAG: hypothetical protein WAK41_12140 [Roseiarcus sp.]|uniref:hypothetical protein n=1 Tax=Roseiarcus sp. TaxID=1969460 RepID=UPI003BB20637
MITKRLQSIAVIATTAGIAVLGLQPAIAEVFDWSYSGTIPGPVTASGTLDATPIGGGVYDVTSISGTRNGVAITGPTAYAGEDNRVYISAPYVDYPGLAYTIADGTAFNVFYDPSTSDSYACGAIGYCEIGPGVVGTSGLGPPRDPVSQISTFTLVAVPELSTWAMMGLGFAGLGFAAYRKTQRGVASAA